MRASRARGPRSLPSSGLWGKPTVINNVKTWASVGPILSRGAAWYAAQGTERNRGTTVFSLVGAVKNTGLVEMPLGMTLREMVFEIGGGMRGKRPHQGRADGRALRRLHPRLAARSAHRLRKTRRGGLDDGLRRHDRAGHGDLHGRHGPILPRLFTADESCGKCVALPRGNQAHAPHPHADLRGPRRPEDFELLERLARTVKSASLCGLGGTAPNPVLTALRYFRDEFESHIRDKKCPAGVCRNLIRLRIDPALCIGCEQCKDVCGVKAIDGQRKSAHRIDDGKCTRCGACRSVCVSEAIVSE